MHKLIRDLAERGWQVKAGGGPLVLPTTIAERYPRLPSEIGEILEGVDECVAADEKSWLLCSPDYRGESESAFAWNEFELQSLEAAAGDEAWRAEILAFWDRHFPVYISVRDCYEYAAVCLDEGSFGQVVSGIEPEYEETMPVASTFSQFVLQLRT